MTAERINPRLRIEIHGPSSGGGGKSSSAIDSASIAKLSGVKVMFLDADRGNAALSDSLSPRYAARVLPTEYDANYAVDLISSCLADGIKLVIIDLGANAMTDSEIAAMIMSICQEAERQLCPCRVYLSLQPAKRGLVDDTRRFAEAFSQHAEIILNFREGMDRTPYANLLEKADGVVTVPQYEVAILELLKDSRLLPADWIANPQPGFEVAAAIYAESLLKRAREPHFRNWLGSHEVESWLEAKAVKAPKRRYIGLDQRHEITNERLKANERFLLAEAALRRLAETSSAETVIEFAREYIAANTALHQQIASSS